MPKEEAGWRYIGWPQLGKVDAEDRRVEGAALKQMAQHVHHLLQDLHLSR